MIINLTCSLQNIHLNSTHLIILYVFEVLLKELGVCYSRIREHQQSIYIYFTLSIYKLYYSISKYYIVAIVLRLNNFSYICIDITFNIIFLMNPKYCNKSIYFII